MGLLHRIQSIVGMAAPVAIAASLVAPTAMAQQPIFDWTGFYIGANAGYGWGRSEVSVPAADPFLPQYQTLLRTVGSGTVKPDGFLGGIQVGYNVQAGNFLWGVEGDAQYMRLKASRDTGFIPGPDPGWLTRFQDDIGASNFFTLRLRSGVVSGAALLYATGGLAVTRLKFSRDFYLEAGAVENFVDTASSTRTGWTVGGGLEYAVAPGWTAKAEYLYADFGSVGFRSDPWGSFIDSKAKLSTHILRFGINRKL